MVVRTVIFPISLTGEQAKTLNNTMLLYTQSWNYCVDAAWNMTKLSKIDLHRATYRSLKKKLGLKSQYLCSSRDRAIEAVRAVRARARKNKKTSKPSAEIIPIRLDERTLSFDKERLVASIATQGSRVKIPLIWHKHARRYESWSCKAGEIGIDRIGRWVLRLIFEKEVSQPKKSGKVVGGDRGTKRPIVLSNNRFYGKRWWKEHERKLFLLISRLQSQGTKSAKRHLIKVWRRLRRFRVDCDRVIAKQIIASLQPGDTIVLEILTNIRDRCGKKGKARKKHRRHMGRWSFKRLENTLRYNADLNGIYVEQIEPQFTSQKCSRCGLVLKGNRKTQSLYSCSCGLTLNADLNAARNIANKWCAANGVAPGPNVDWPIVTSSSRVQLQAPELIRG